MSERKQFLDKYEKKIIIIGRNKEIIVPENYTMSYITRNGQIILCKNLEDRSSHFYVAENYMGLKIDEDEEEHILIFKSIAEGNAPIIDISDKKTKMLDIIYREKSMTKQQEQTIQRLKDIGYECIEEEYEDDKLLKRLKCEQLPILSEIKEIEEKLTINTIKINNEAEPILAEI